MAITDPKQLEEMLSQLSETARLLSQPPTPPVVPPTDTTTQPVALAPLPEDPLEEELEQIDTVPHSKMAPPSVPIVSFVFETIGFVAPWTAIGWVCSAKCLGGTAIGKAIYLLLFSPIALGCAAIIGVTYLAYQRRSSYLIIRLLQILGAWAIAFHLHLHAFGGAKL